MLANLDLETNGQRHVPAALFQGNQLVGTHWIEGCVNPTAGLDATTRKIPSPVKNRTPVVHIELNIIIKMAFFVGTASDPGLH
jgi:hypothetical protein